MKMKKRTWVKLICFLILLLLACSPAQRDWRANTSLDLGVGGESSEIKYSYPYVGMSYYLSHGFSASLGVWHGYYNERGPYWGINWSFLPFEK